MRRIRTRISCPRSAASGPGSTPAEEDGLRIDAGYRSGDAVSPYYDAMLAKVIAWAPTRDVAIDRLNRGLEETDVRGIVTNIPFLSALVTHPTVRANAIDTGFIERELKELTPRRRSRAAISNFARPWRPSSARSRSGAHGSAIRRGGPLAGCRWAGASGCFRSGRGRRPSTRSACATATGRRPCRSASSELAFAFAPAGDGGFDLTLDGVKSAVVAVRRRP